MRYDVYPHTLLTRISYLLHCQSVKLCVLLTSDNREESACLPIILSFTIPFLYFLCSGAYLSLGLRLPEGSWPCYKSERTTRDLWFMGDHPRFPTRAVHSCGSLVFFLLHNPTLFEASDWWKASNCGTSYGGTYN